MQAPGGRVQRCAGAHHAAADHDDVEFLLRHPAQRLAALGGPQPPLSGLVLSTAWITDHIRRLTPPQVGRTHQAYRLVAQLAAGPRYSVRS